MDYEKKAGKNAKYLTWVDHLKGGFQPTAERENYLAEQARKRADEAAEEARRKAAAKKTNSGS